MGRTSIDSTVRESSIMVGCEGDKEVSMGLRINTNIPSISAQRTLGINGRKQSEVLAKMSSGSRINKASDDAAGLAISEKLRATVRGLDQANRNANDGISFIQTAEGGLNEVSNILIRMRELSMQAASDTVGNTERGFTDLEFQNLKQEVQRISQVTEFNGKKLLDGKAQDFEFQIGINNNAFEDRIVYEAGNINSSQEALGVDVLDILSKETSREGLATIDNAITHISGQRAELGAVQNRLSSTINNLQVASENMNAANSRIRDTDFASATAKNAKFNILSQAGSSVLAQANNFGGIALKLLG